MSQFLEELQKGGRFPLSELVNNFAATKLFWRWWWDNCVDYKTLTRPEIIADGDPILIPTIEKFRVEEQPGSPLLEEHFDDWALGKFERKTKHEGPRADLQFDILRYLMRHVSYLPEKKIIFSGGGYGAGKTQTMLTYIKCGSCQGLKNEAAIGVDRCKQLIPEFSYIARISDGRASLTTQKESVMISERLFDVAVSRGASFVWDSSMSNAEVTQRKIDVAREAGYRLDMMGVIAPPEAVVRRAMVRAKITRRFANPQVLAKSHLDFFSNWATFVPQFDRAYIFDNSDERREPYCVLRWV
jgi:predicted ABC-type ATPase